MTRPSSRTLLLVVGAVVVAAGLLLLASVSRAAPRDQVPPPPRTSWMSRACAQEDGVDCYWNAGQQGNGGGRSFYVHRFRGGPTCVMYVERRFARTHDHCGPDP